MQHVEAVEDDGSIRSDVLHGVEGGLSLGIERDELAIEHHRADRLY